MKNVKMGWLIIGIILAIIAFSSAPATMGISVFAFWVPAKRAFEKAFEDT